MTRAFVVSLLMLTSLIAVAAVACSSGSRGVPAVASYEDATQRGPFGVGVTTLELVDTSRETEAHGGMPERDERRLMVEVWYPTAPSEEPEAVDTQLDAGAGPYPLIVFAHGFSSFRRQSASYTQHLASHGFVVASPDFPLTNLETPGGPRYGGLLEQPGDVSFIIDRFLAFDAEAGHRFEGAIDEESIGVTGHSFGGFTTLLTTYGPLRDDRVDAALAISASGCFLSEELVADTSVPVMLLTGTNDLIVDPAGNRRAYELANPPRYLVEVEGANHIRFADADAEDEVALEVLGRAGRDSEEAAGDAGSISETLGTDFTSCGDRPERAPDEPIDLERQQELLRAYATPFFDAFLRDSDEARSLLEDELASLDGAHVELERE